VSIRWVTGWLWRFVAFRYLCLACIARGVAVRWIAMHTPCLSALKAMFLEIGDFPAAAEAERLMSGK